MFVEATWLFILALVLSGVVGYLLGSVNCAIVVCHLFYKKDVRELGSGNAGMTNVLRNFGKKGAILTLVGDVAKGVLAVFLGRVFMLLLVPGVDGLFTGTLYGAYIAAICAILGHMFPLYFGFKGGKGVAVSGGVILALQPLLAGILILIFLVVLMMTKMVSFGSVVGISMYPFVTLGWTGFVTHTAVVYSTVCAAIISGLVVWMHRANIARIRAGTEYRFGQKKQAELMGEDTADAGSEAPTAEAANAKGAPAQDEKISTGQAITQAAEREAARELAGAKGKGEKKS